MRSMAKGNRVKLPVSDGVHVEIVVINDEEGNPVLPNDGRDIEHEFIPNPADNSSHVFNKDLQVDPVKSVNFLFNFGLSPPFLVGFSILFQLRFCFKSYF